MGSTMNSRICVALIPVGGPAPYEYDRRRISAAGVPFSYATRFT